MRPVHLWSSISILLAQLPVRYALKADVLSFLWREYRVSGEYRLFQWAPPFIASVERAKWEGLTIICQGSYYRRLPYWGAIIRLGLRYYFLRRNYAPEGLWGGMHLGGSSIVVPDEKMKGGAGGGIGIGYQHVFHQGYGGIIEPYLLIEGIFSRYKGFCPIQMGINVGLASRKWNRRNLQ
ncbi:MAG: hypothetical protein NZ933_04280 [Bacteroidia bacterium]|nr:hypothetical protein [Bacteroidia bacterium]